MSRAGKFIPGGGQARKPGEEKAAPIRIAPDGASADSSPASPFKDKLSRDTARVSRPKSLSRSSGRSLPAPFTLMVGIGSAFLMILVFYFEVYMPDQDKIKQAQAETQKVQKDFDDYKIQASTRLKELEDTIAKKRATLILDTDPTGASVLVAGRHLTSPINVTDLLVVPTTIQVTMPGYEDFTQSVNLSYDRPLDLGKITLTRKAGDLSVACTRPGVRYKLNDSKGGHREGDLPVNLSGLDEGNYTLIASDHDWSLPPVPIKIKNKETSECTVTFPYVTLKLNSNPPGATVREGRNILGTTPVNLTNQRAGKRTFSIDFPPYTFQRISVQLPEAGGEVNQTVDLHKGKDFYTTTANILMVEIPSGYWVGKYLVKQSEYETVMSANPSSFHRASRPVESVTWFEANEFCKRLTQMESQAGTLPAGFHYTLPTESQWTEFSADADINQAATSRSDRLSGSQDVGYSEPNCYGLYDTLGNVWEWCSDLNAAQNAYSLRGGSWLNSIENFPTPDVRLVAIPKYSDKFTGFRVVLVKN